jgi:hypothetical protein
VFCVVAATLAVAILNVTTARIAATQKINLHMYSLASNYQRENPFKYYLLLQTYWEPLRATALLILLFFTYFVSLLQILFTMPNLTHISKLLSKILRHQPDLIDIQLDENGWVEVSTLLQNLEKYQTSISFEQLKEVVDTNNKKDFPSMMISQKSELIKDIL